MSRTISVGRRAGCLVVAVLLSSMTVVSVSVDSMSGRSVRL